MANVIFLKNAMVKKRARTKQISLPVEIQKLSPAVLYNYHTNLMMCEKLFLVSPGEFPSAEDLAQMHVSEAQKIIRELNRIFEEKAEKRHMRLTGKTMARAAVDKLDIYFK
ncbi:MAG: hypothetical protein FIA99_07225 [Ruminiclostridium sp.]|nr:hypothetical protein [Ruminiclostridium sp.]